MTNQSLNRMEARRRENDRFFLMGWHLAVRSEKHIHKLLRAIEQQPKARPALASTTMLLVHGVIRSEPEWGCVL